MIVQKSSISCPSIGFVIDLELVSHCSRIGTFLVARWHASLRHRIDPFEHIVMKKKKRVFLLEQTREEIECLCMCEGELDNKSDVFFVFSNESHLLRFRNTISQTELRCSWLEETLEVRHAIGRFD